jgi:hypothetical protein
MDYPVTRILFEAVTVLAVNGNSKESDIVVPGIDIQYPGFPNIEPDPTVTTHNLSSSMLYRTSTDLNSRATR